MMKIDLKKTWEIHLTINKDEAMVIHHVLSNYCTGEFNKDNFFTKQEFSKIQHDIKTQIKGIMFDGAGTIRE